MVDIVKHLLNCIEQENGVNDGGPGSGRKPGSKNKTHKMTFTPQEKQGIVSRINAQHPNPNSRLHRQSPKELKERLGTLEHGARESQMDLEWMIDKHDQRAREAERWGEKQPKTSFTREELVNLRDKWKSKRETAAKLAEGLDAKPNFSTGCNIASLILDTFDCAPVQDGGPGSGNFGHGGRKGHVGGSSEVQGNEKTLVLNEKDKNKIASTLNTITKVLNKNQASFKDSESWESESEFDKAVADVKDTLNDKDIHIGVNGEYTALNVRITLDDKNATIKYDSKVRGKDWNTEDNKNRLSSIVNVTNKTVEDGIEQSDIPKVAELMLGIFSGETIEDGGPGSGRKKGSHNRNRMINPINEKTGFTRTQGALLNASNERIKETGDDYTAAHQAYRDFVDKNSDRLREMRRGWQKAIAQGDKEAAQKYMEQMKPINREAFRLKENAEKQWSVANGTSMSERGYQHAMRQRNKEQQASVGKPPKYMGMTPERRAYEQQKEENRRYSRQYA